MPPSSGPRPHPLVLLLPVLLLGTSPPAAAAPAGTLYDWDEPIVQLSAGNFSQTVLSSRTAWVVEFYAAWCGHCQNFAPTWSQLARDVQGWERVVRVAAVACSSPGNSDLCRDHGVWSYPAVKFFEAGAASDSTGYPYSGEKNLDDLRDAIVMFVSKVWEVDRPAGWPSLTHIRRSDELVSAAGELSPPPRLLLVLAVDDRDRHQKMLAKKVMLDVSALAPRVLLGWFRYHAARAHGLHHLPSLHRIIPATGGGLSPVLLENVTRDSIREAIDAWAWPDERGVATSAAPPTTPDATVPAANRYVVPSGVHMIDLESSLAYSLLHEVATQPVLDAERQSVLENHLTLLYKYIPFKPAIKSFLNRTLEELERLDGVNITGREWGEMLTAMQRPDSHLPATLRWAGCMGTLPRYRGYPCSVWMTYHTLTVSAYLTEATNPFFSPATVITTMRDYVRLFFGCRLCAAHFAEMSAGAEGQILSRHDGVLWLWGAHNKVNNRLAGDTTEDPSHPKVQFPAPSVCPECRADSAGLQDNNTVWDIGNVVIYLAQFYDPVNIIEPIEGEGFNNSMFGQSHKVSHNIRWQSGGLEEASIENAEMIEDELEEEEREEEYRIHDHYGQHSFHGAGNFEPSITSHQQRLHPDDGARRNRQHRHTGANSRFVDGVDDGGVENREGVRERQPVRHGNIDNARERQPLRHGNRDKLRERQPPRHVADYDRQAFGSANREGLARGGGAANHYTDDTARTRDFYNRKAEQQRLEEEERQVEERERLEEEQRAIRQQEEEQRRLQHERLLEEQRLAERNRLEKQRKLEEERRLEAHRKLEDERRLEAQRIEERRRLEEEHQLQLRKREEERVLAEQRRLEAQKLEEQRRQEEEERREKDRQEYLRRLEERKELERQRQQKLIENQQRLEAEQRERERAEEERRQQEQRRPQYSDTRRPQYSATSRQRQDSGSAYPETSRHQQRSGYDNTQTNRQSQHSRYTDSSTSRFPSQRWSNGQSHNQRSSQRYVGGSTQTEVGNGGLANEGIPIAHNGYSSHVQQCALQETDWSDCSATCDTGISSRTTNRNPQCEMKTETRLCQLRPCNARFPDWTKLDWHAQKCPQFGSTYRDAYPRTLRHGNCETERKQLWRYCGMCPHKCCYPSKTRTVPMRMRCDEGRDGVKNVTVNVMMFDFCTCEATCPDHY